MATQESSVPVHPSTEEHDIVEAHDSGLECPRACLDGWEFVGYIDEHSE